MVGFIRFWQGARLAAPGLETLLGPVACWFVFSTRAHIELGFWAVNLGKLCVIWVCFAIFEILLGPCGELNMRTVSEKLEEKVWLCWCGWFFCFWCVGCGGLGSGQSYAS